MLFVGLIHAQTKSISITKITEEIKIDGELNEAIWQKAEKASDFWQNFPFDTSLAISKTEVMLAYDDNNIYISAICYDSIKKDYVITSLKRDWSYPASDAFVATIDPFSDKQNGFSFGLNPYGVQREGLVANGGGQGVTTDWDNKWFGEVKRYAGRWTLEMAIPFKTLRFKGELNEWRINFSRNDLKRNENSCWSKVPRQFNIATLAFTGLLKWDKAPQKTGTNISIIPYAITRVSKDYINNTPTKLSANIGGDAKIALSSSLNLDLTVNPDFSQVEVDRQVTNLTRFSLFFPERRQFFIENSDLFERFGFSQIRPFFSRRIGLNNGNIIPIVGGARLSGKPNENWRIGLMNIQTAQKNSLNVLGQNYTVAAAQYNVFSRSNVAFIFVNRQAFDKGIYKVNDYNRIVGLDYNLNSGDNKWFGKFFYHHSLSNQKNINSMAHASFLLYQTEKVSIMWNHEYVHKDYNAETGFTPRISQLDGNGNTVKTTYWRLEPRLNYFFYPKKSIINKMGPELYLDLYANKDYKQTDRLIRASYDFNFTNTSSLSFDYTNLFTKLLYNADVTFSGQDSVLSAGNYNYQNANIFYKTNIRRKLNGTINVNYGSYFTGKKLSIATDIIFRKQPYGLLTLSYSHDEILMPYLNKKVSLDLFGPKIELSFTRKMFFTTFLQYNAQIKNFNINARLQYRFKPMSDIFIVYSDNYDTSEFGNPTYNFNRLGKKNRALVIKFVYWFTA